jgi:hypothetical protein
MYGLFKNWMMHYFGNMGVYLGEGFYHNNWKPFLWQQAGTFSIGGVGGLAGYSMLNSTNEMLSDDSFVEDLYNWWGYDQELEGIAGEEFPGKMADFVYYGMPGLMGVSLQSRAAAPGQDLSRDFSHLWSTVILDRAMAGAQALGTGIRQWQHTGQHPGHTQEFWNAFARFAAPRTLQKAMQLNENGAIQSLRTGNNLISDVNMSGQVMHVLGMNSTDVAKSYEMSGILWKEQNEMRNQVSALGSAVAEARMAGDWQQVSELYKEAYRSGIPVDSIQKSADAYIQKRNGNEIDKQFDEMRQRNLRSTLGID